METKARIEFAMVDFWFRWNSFWPTADRVKQNKSSGWGGGRLSGAIGQIGTFAFRIGNLSGQQFLAKSKFSKNIENQTLQYKRNVRTVIFMKKIEVETWDLKISENFDVEFSN